MSTTFVQDLNTYSRSLPRKAPPVAVGHPEIGQIGLVIPQRGLQLRGMRSRELEALLRDEARADLRAMQLRKELRAAITSWDGVLNARTNGKYWDFLGNKLSQTTVASAWANFFLSGGTPVSGAYTAIPGGAVMTRASTGAWPLKNPATNNKTYLVNVGANHLTGTNIVLLADILVAAGNITANLNSAQTVNTAALTRYTTGEGVMMILEVTTQLGATPANVTVAYTNQAAQSRSSGAIAMTASAITFRLQPSANGASIQFQGGDYGVQSVQTVTFSAAMGSGAVAMLLYKPLLLIPTLSSTTWVERSTPGMLGGITELVFGSDSQLGCLAPFVLPSTTSTGVQSYFIQTAEG